MDFVLDNEKFFVALLELIRRTSVSLCPDLRDALEAASASEEPGSPAQQALAQILENISLAEKTDTPVCQDTGTNIYHVLVPAGVSLRALEDCIRRATRAATEKSWLRPNSVDSVSGKNSGDNTGIFAPFVHFEEWEKAEIKVSLMLKGGGSENVSAQYSLPDSSLGAGRNLEGVRRCVLDAVQQAQGQGCAPGVIGVGIGGDRLSGYLTAKLQLFRKLPDINSNPELAELEKRLLGELNSLGIGPMGFGGRTTALGVKIGAAHRVPASFFVSVAYMCWAERRRSMIFGKEGATYD
ncbi:MAG: fumarate hydratase [Lentisphaerae bacterium GWF2_52_8]|nr:MAG: fumarate hydratase [Lentisphaerae bacterium GWF2_52_8]